MLFTTTVTVQQILISAGLKPLMHKCIIGFIINHITMIEIKCNKWPTILQKIFEMNLRKRVKRDLL